VSTASENKRTVEKVSLNK